MPSALTIFLISGRPDPISQAANEAALWSSIDVRPFEEKWITSPAKVKDLLRSATSPVVAFGCKDLALQRFQVALKFYLLVFGPSERYVLDESASVIRVTWPRFLTADLARFVLEIAVSMAVLVHATVRLWGLRRRSEERG